MSAAENTSQSSLFPHHRLPLAAIAMALVVPICWGGNFTASKLAMEHFPPFLTVLLRFSAVAALLAPLVLPAYFKGARVSIRDMFVISICYITLHFTLIFVAMNNGLSIASTVIGVQLGAPFSCVLAAVFHNDRLGAWRSFGMAVAFVGVIVIAGAPDVSAHWGSFLLVVLGAFAWAAANIYMKRIGNVGVAPFLFWPALLSLPQIGLLSLLFEHDQLALIETAPVTAWGGILYSTVFSTFVGYGLWYHLIKRYPLSQVTPFSLLVPVVGIGTAMVVYDERLTSLLLIGGALTIVGVGVITLRRPRWAILGDK
jgi:O-acetylserine/cysteine efflux transporter